MSPRDLVLAVFVSATAAAAFVPLVNKHFSYPNGIPYQADTDNLERGTQRGYNRCNATTAGQASLCQTSFLNSVDDFCLWAPISPGSTVGDVEGEMVAWCTKPGRGTRVIPAGALRGVQFMKTPDYVQVVGFIDQSQINIRAGDDGGEMDPHGADLRGNPLGGLMYSNAYGSNKNAFNQVIEWHNFMGSDSFCLKACDPAGRNAARFCEHIYDRIGCAYNAPNNAQQGVFESCQGENQDFPGVYVDAGGVTRTYTQPPESLGAITAIPYTARVPRSSACAQFASAVLYAPGAGVTIPPGPMGPATSASASASANPSKTTSSVQVSSTSGSVSNSSGSSGVLSTSTAPALVPQSTTVVPATTTGPGVAPPSQTGSNDAQTVAASSLVSLLGIVFAGLFFS